MPSLTRLALENGLQILLKEIHTAPLISAWTWYRVGSRDELPGRTGLSHWVEHMQFKGTPTFPASILDRAIAREGGMWNAFTYLDWTAYFETLPAARIDLALQLESDRMIHSVFDPDEVESERTVIIAEREGDENEPLFRLGEAVQKAAFRAHPYRHEVIGEKEDLHAISRADLYLHYRSYYTPGNAVLSVAGDFETGDMIARIRRYFDGLPAAAAPGRAVPPEAPIPGEVHVDVEGHEDTAYLEIAYHAPAAADADFFAVAVLDSLLAGPSNLNMFGGGGMGNKTCRLYRALVEKELAVSVHGGAAATLDPFLYSLTLTLPPNRTAGQALAAVDAEIARLQEQLVPAAEVARAIKQARAMFAYGSENITNQAFWLGHAEMFASYDWFETYLERLAAVSPEDVRRAARTWFNPQARVVGTYRPAGGGARK